MYTGLDLQPIICAAEAPVVVHGTYKKAWESIKHQVLCVVCVYVCMCVCMHCVCVHVYACVCVCICACCVHCACITS